MSVNTNTDLNQGEHNHFDLIEIKNPTLPYTRNIDGFGNGHYIKLTFNIRCPGCNMQLMCQRRYIIVTFLLKTNHEAAYISVPYQETGNFSLKITSKGDQLQVNDGNGTYSSTKIISNSNMVAKLRITADSDFSISQIVLTPSTNIAIIPYNFPIRKINEDIAEKLQTAILESIKQISDKKNIKIGFDEFTYINGYLKIICATVDIGIWLEKLLKALPLWKSEKLKIVNLNEVPIPKICSFYLQGKKMNTDTLLQTISAQNLVHIDFLDVLDAEIDNNGTKYYLLMDMITWNKLTGYIYFDLSRIPLQEYEETENTKTA